MAEPVHVGCMNNTCRERLHQEWNTTTHIRYDNIKLSEKNEELQSTINKLQLDIKNLKEKYDKSKDKSKAKLKEYIEKQLDFLKKEKETQEKETQDTDTDQEVENKNVTNKRPRIPMDTPKELTSQQVMEKN